MAFPAAEIAPSQGYPSQGPRPEFFLSPSVSSITSAEQQPTRDELSLQVDINERLLHLLGPDYTPAMALRGFRERGRSLSTAINSASERLDDGSVSLDELSEIGDRSACLRISAGIIANKFNLNLQDYIDKKLMQKMQIKYRPDEVTEIRFYGTPDNPGEKTGPQALALLKGSFDEDTGTQGYFFRGLPIPDSEEEARTPALRFNNHLQELAYWWEVRSLGKDLVPSERYVNITAEETGEVDEVLDLFKGMTSEQVNSIPENSTQDPRFLELMDLLGYELADVFIGTWCGDAAVGIDSDTKDQERMGIAVEKYADGPKLRRVGIEAEKRLGWMDTFYKRIKAGLNPPPPLVVVAARSRQN